MRISDWSSDVCSSDLGDAAEAAGPAMVGHKAGSVCNPEPTVFTLGAGDGGDRRMRFLRTWLQGMNDKRRYAAYDEYLARSEEHTSELQSLMHISIAVFCLQKKKTNQTLISQHHIE